MTDSLYITTTEARTGKSLVSLGIMNLLLRRTSRVGVFRPIIEAKSASEHDKNIELLRSYFKLKIPYEETYAFLEHEANNLLGQGHFDAFMDTVIEKYKALESKCDFILCIGSDLEGDETAFEFDLNAQIAKNLGCPVLIVTRADERDLEHIKNSIHVTFDAFENLGVKVLGTIVNRTREEYVDELGEFITNTITSEEPIVSIIPADPRLSSPTIREIVEQCNAEVLLGHDELDGLAYEYTVAAMWIRNFLKYITNRALIITSGDRDGILLSTMLAHNSKSYPGLAGIVLSGGIRPADDVMELLNGLEHIIPVLSVKTNTYDTAQMIANVRSYITGDNPRKIQRSLELFEEYIDTERILSEFTRVQPKGMTPRMFTYNLVEKAKSNKQHIVLPEGEDERILRAAEILINRDIVDLTILGNPDKIVADIRRLGLKLDTDRLNLLDPNNAPQFNDYAQTLVERRKHKGLALDAALDMMRDVSYFGTMMVFKGDADGMVSGAAHTTAHTIRPSLQFVKTKPGVSVVSSVFFMALDDRVLVYGDCAVNPNPTADQLAEIAISSAETAMVFGIEPRIAMLSYSTGASGSGADVDKVREATQIAQERRPDLILEGPMQYDAAVAKDVAAKKMPGSEVAGRATVLIFPDLNTGNNTYKAVQRETGAIAIGPVLQGLRKPVNDLSRGALVEDIVNTVVITAIQAQNAE